MLIKKDPDTIKSYFEDASNLKGGHADEVVIPDNGEDLKKILKEADSNKVPVTISGGGTGTTGSRIPFGGIVISMERFNKIYNISEKNMSSLVEAGVLVDEFKDACEKKKLFYTSHPTEKTASVGGTVATNASGSRSFRYGPTRKYVKRLKMVFAGGETLDIKRGERYLKRSDSGLKLDSGRIINVPLPSYKIPVVKNSAGYFAGDGMDAIDLFIGQEGTFSVVTDIAFKLVNMPQKILSSFVFFDKEIDSWDFADEARRLSREKKADRDLSIDALSIEYFDRNALRLLRQKAANIPENAEAAIFFEQEVIGSREDDVVERWLELIARHHGSADNTWVAMNQKEAEKFTSYRHYIPESINEAVRRSSYQKLSTDIAVPGTKFREMMCFYKDVLDASAIEHVVFGHIGECHVHLNLLPKSESELAASKRMCLSFIKKGVSLGGTISAEHGVGKTKREYLKIMYGEKGILEMVKIKKAFDPNCILGLDNIFPRKELKDE